MNERVNRKYVFILATLAIVVLIVGALFRPKVSTPEPPSPSETASLQSRVRREQLAETATYFAERAGVLGESVLYRRELGASAVAWYKPGQAVTSPAPGSSAFGAPLLLVHTDSGKAPVRPSDTPSAGRWLLIVGRTGDDQLLWNPVVYGGARQTTCAGKAFRELIVNARPNDALLGAGVFDLDGALVGVVAACNGAYHLISASSIPDLIKAFESDSRKTTSYYGFEVEELNDALKQFFSLAQGLFVTELVTGDAAAEAGIQAGDVITAIHGQPLTRKQELWNALASEDDQMRSFEVRRNNRKLTIQMPNLERAKQIAAAAESFGMRVVAVPKSGEALQVGPGGSAYRAGLRTGDILLRIGGKPSSGPADLTRAISTMDGNSILLVWQHERAQKAALVFK